MPNHAIGANPIYDYSKRLACSYKDDPELELVACILQQAISDLYKDKRITTSYDCGTNRQTARKDAIDWFLDTQPNWWPFTFENICSFLSIDADRLRDALTKSHLLPTQDKTGDKNVLVRGLRRKD